MTPRARAEDELKGVDLVLVDGNNLLHAVRGSGDRGGMAWLLPRLADRLPAGIRVIVVVDGHPTPGLSDRRPAARGVTVRHSGSASADDLIIRLLETRPYAERVRSLVVSNDRELGDRARRVAVPSRGVDWLVRTISGLSSVTTGPPPGPVGIGRGRAPVDAASPSARRGGLPAADRDPWRPGRSATRKRGPAHRAPRRGRPG